MVPYGPYGADIVGHVLGIATNNTNDSKVGIGKDLLNQLRARHSTDIRHTARSALNRSPVRVDKLVIKLCVGVSE